MAKRKKYYTSLEAALDGDKPGHLLLVAISHQMPDPVADLRSYLLDWELHAKPPKYRVLLDGGKMIAEYPSWFSCMVRDPEGTVYVGEDDGFIRCQDGQAELFVLDAKYGTMQCAYARAAGSVVFGDILGYVIHVDGGHITSHRVVTSKARIRDSQTDVSAIHGIGSDFMVAVGIRGLVSCYRSGEWAQVKPPADDFFKAVFCRSLDEVYVGGWRGKMWRWDGASRWTRLKVDVPFDADAVSFTDIKEFQGQLYAAGVEYGVFWLDGDTWRPVGQQKDEDVRRLQVTRAGLVGLGGVWGNSGSWLSVFDGKTWTVEQVHIPPQ